MSVDNLPRRLDHNLVAGRGITMQVTGHNGSDVKCSYCKNIGHFIQGLWNLNQMNTESTQLTREKVEEDT